jgi:1,4-alpha-glucan branching enzyme
MTDASTRPGMGSTPFEGGVSFRVWAPDASAVSVQGEVTGTDGAAIALAAEPGGLWSADIAGAQAGQAYQYLLTFPSDPSDPSEPAAPDPRPRIDPYARLVQNNGNDADAAIVFDEAAFDWGVAGYTAPTWRELVIYELHVGTFDPVAGQIGGTLADVADKLSYLSDLGITAIELMPVAEYEGTQSWGYDPGAPFAVETSIGGPDALKDLVLRAHELGIAVLLDVVYNHFGPDDSILWDFDTWPGAPAEGVYFYPPRFAGDPRADSPWGSRPDYGRPEVRAYLRSNALAWLQDTRLDGLRFDATAYIRNTCSTDPPPEDIADGWLLLQQINDDVAAAQPWKITVAEDMRDDSWVTRPTATGGAGFGSQWDGDFMSQVRAAVEATDDGERDMTSVAAALQRSFAPAAYSRVVFTESHDADGNGRSRVPTEIDPADPASYWAKKRSTLAAAIVFTAPGIPMIFQGQEILEAQPFTQDPGPVEWTNTGLYSGILALYRDLIALRRDLGGTTAGLGGDGLNVFHVNNVDKLVAYHRWSAGGAGDDVLVICNFADRSYTDYQLGAPRPGTWHVRFNSDSSDYDSSFTNSASYDCDSAADGRDGLDFSLAVGIGPYTAIVLSQQP